MATSTPWGAAQSSKQITRGIMSYSTAGHGGLKVSPTMLVNMQPAFVNTNSLTRKGWFEEDCACTMVIVSFPEYFTPEQVKGAHASCKNWYPDQYEQAFNVKVDLAESHVLRERAFKAQHANDFIVTSACGDWKEGVPKGFVECHAYLGGRNPSGERGVFLVPEAEYTSRNEFGFVIDTTHQRVK